MATTWDPSAKGSHVTLSNGNLTAAFDGVDGTNTSVRSVNIGGASDKLYFEAQLGATDTEFFLAIGFCNASFSVTGDLFYASPNAIVGGDGGDIYMNGSPVGSQGGGTLAAGDRVCCAIDTANKKAWFRKNNGNWNNSGTANPATNTGGLTITGAGPYYALAAGESVSNWIAAFAAADWSYSAPSGFTEFNAGGVSYTLAGSAAGSGSASGAILANRPVAGSAAGVGSQSGAIGALRPIAGAAAGVGSQSGALGALRPLAGAAAGAGSAQATVGAGPGALAGAVIGASTALGALLKNAPLVGAAAGVGSAAMNMQGGSLWVPVSAPAGAWGAAAAPSGTWTPAPAASGTWS